jgi:hypothetical protein
MLKEEIVPVVYPLRETSMVYPVPAGTLGMV